MPIQTNPVNWFEIPVSDLRRAKRFYEALLDLELELNEFGPLKMAWFPINQGLPGATGALVKGERYTPSHSGTLVYLTVKEIEEMLSRVKSHGGKVLLPKTGIGDYGFIAHFEDTEGNRVALHAKS